jgi:hypothetical protein
MMRLLSFFRSTGVEPLVVGQEMDVPEHLHFLSS